MPRGEGGENKNDKDVLEELVENFKNEISEYVSTELFSGTGEEEATEEARTTIEGVLTYCAEQASHYARTPEEYKKEVIECLNEWHSTAVLIANRILRKLIKEMGG